MLPTDDFNISVGTQKSGVSGYGFRLLSREMIVTMRVIAWKIKSTIKSLANNNRKR